MSVFLKTKKYIAVLRLEQHGKRFVLFRNSKQIPPHSPPGTVQIVLGDESYDVYEHAEPFDTLAAFCFKVNT